MTKNKGVVALAVAAVIGGIVALSSGAKAKDKPKTKPPGGNGGVPTSPPIIPDDNDGGEPDEPLDLKEGFPDIYAGALELQGLIGTMTRGAAYRKRDLATVLSAFLDSNDAETVAESELEWLTDIVQRGSAEGTAGIEAIGQGTWVLNNSDNPSVLRQTANVVAAYDPELAGALRTKATEIEAAGGVAT